jgi:eukaryotic-like serine/threonine-protein kinase
MSMRAGTRLGAYEILSVLGAGGMGEVYRARDTRLGREVAIKVVLDAFAADADRVARFQREARVLASLNHPHIAALYGMEEADGRHFLVMELVEGETLADRLRRGPMPLAEALAIAIQIVDALEAAHEKGIVHRDLKPANVKVTPDDTVKVLDFGLAKAVSADSAAIRADANSPTLSMMASQAGVILGTAAYMSPEQAKGLPADHRSDVFSFGSLLFEMLSGRQPFQGDTAPDVLASVLVREADVGHLPRDLNPRLIDLLRRCLEKHPKRRWQAIGDVRAELETIAAAPRAPATDAVTAPPRSRGRRALPAAFAAIVVGAGAWVAAWMVKPSAPQTLVRFAVVLPADMRISTPLRNAIAISPDGTKLLYFVNDQIYVRALDEFAGTPIAGTAEEKLTSPTFSPDGRAIAFFSSRDKALKRIATSGGVATILCTAFNPLGLSWSAAGIVYAQGGQVKGGVWRVSSNGGDPERLVTLGAHEVVYGPQLLPDGKTILFTLSTPSGPEDKWESARIIAQTLKTGARKVLVDGAADARYLPPGYLAYARQGTVYVTRLDASRLAITGPAAPLIEGVRRAAGGMTGLADFAVSTNGSLVYVTGPVAIVSGQSDLILTDMAKGTVRPLKVSGALQTPRSSPDGTQVAFVSDDARGVEVYVYQVDGTTQPRRLTFGGKNRFPVWSPDGTRIVYQSDREGDLGLFWQPADGTGTAQRLTKAAPGDTHVPLSWYGDVLLFDVGRGKETSLSTYSFADRKIAPFGGVQSSVPSGAVFSPDGHWVAYDVGKDNEGTVFVQPFPATGDKYELTRQNLSDHPHHPMWSSDGKRIFFVPGPGGFAAVSVTSKPAFAFGNRVPVERPFATGTISEPRPTDIRPDGQILGLQTAAQTAAANASVEIRVVLNWLQEVKARLATGG